MGSAAAIAFCKTTIELHARAANRSRSGRDCPRLCRAPVYTDRVLYTCKNHSLEEDEEPERRTELGD